LRHNFAAGTAASLSFNTAKIYLFANRLSLVRLPAYHWQRTKWPMPASERDAQVIDALNRIAIITLFQNFCLRNGRRGPQLTYFNRRRDGELHFERCGPRGVGTEGHFVSQRQASRETNPAIEVDVFGIIVDILGSLVHKKRLTGELS
jgi:hypothetical protein